MRFFLLFLLAPLTTVSHASEITPPRALVEGVSVELVAAEPQIVTPVGMAFDHQGRLLVIESHTHKRQEDYDGPKLDRIRTLTDSNGDGKLDTWGTFAEGFTFALNMAVHPETGDVYLVCRNSVRILRDTNGDGKSDEEEVLIEVESEVDYPHNGLGGITFASDDSLYLGFGENFGAEYKITGSDGSELVGRGGPGIVIHCDANGGDLKRLATGFWNPFGLCREGVHLFAVDNDPDASPPCRLIHVLPAGDYGHRIEYGRAGIHPLQAWDGEIPGTLGMMAGTGEAPCTVLWRNGWLWVTSWGEHRIERYRVNPDKEGFTAEREVVLQGNADFRPTGMAVAPDGSFYFGDWVSRSYPVHGAGRIWRMTIGDETSGGELPPRYAKGGVADRQRNIYNAASLPDNVSLPLPYSDAVTPEMRLASLQALRFRGATAADAQLGRALNDPNPDIRLYALRWICDEYNTEYLDEVTKLLEGDIPSERYYLSVLGAIDWLSNERKQRSSGIADGLLARELRNGNRSSGTHALALRLISPDDKLLTLDKLQEFLESDDESLRTQAARTLAGQSNPARFAELVSIATDEANLAGMRADAVAGLAADARNQQSLLSNLAADAPAEVQREADRVLRLAKLIDSPKEVKPKPDALEEWLELLAVGEGDADSGRRLFHSPLGARCSVCHRFEGRGGNVGPELTHVAKKLSRERLLESILQPSREVSPQYEPWILETDEGQVVTGLRLPKGGDDGVEPYADDQGNEFTLRSDQIETRMPSKTSIMPAGLEQLVSVQDLRDLVAYLRETE